MSTAQIRGPLPHDAEGIASAVSTTCQTLNSCCRSKTKRPGSAGLNVDTLAITFGVGTGHIEADRALPGDALHADRYTVLAIVLYENSSAAENLRERYGVDVTQGEVTLAALREVQQRVRADLRGEDADNFYGRLELEPALPLTDHIVDANPKFFGFRCWMLTELGVLTTPDGLAQPNRLLPLGVTYTPSVPYARMLAHHLEASFPVDAPDVPLAVTYGHASGEILCSGDEWTCNTKLYTPLVGCVHRTRAHFSRLVSYRYGIDVQPTVDNRTLRAMERAGRARVAPYGTEILDMAHAIDTLRPSVVTRPVTTAPYATASARAIQRTAHDLEPRVSALDTS